MADEEDVLLPVYSERAEFPVAGAPKLYFDDHAKMRSYIELFKQRTSEIAAETEIERALLQLLDREAFYLRLCSHHDRRESDFLYPILDDLLSEEERHKLLDRVRLRGEKH
jgi:hemerythrin-like domain-containing protein